MVCFYIMIVCHLSSLCLSTFLLTDIWLSVQAICAWFYVGQPELEIMLNCPGSVAQAIAGEAAAEGSEGAGEAVEIAARVLKRML
jgi:hypothetical protein